MNQLFSLVCMEARMNNKSEPSDFLSVFGSHLLCMHYMQSPAASLHIKGAAKAGNVTVAIHCNLGCLMIIPVRLCSCLMKPGTYMYRS